MPPIVDVQGMLDAAAHWLPKCAIACFAVTAAVCLATWISMRTRLLWRGWLSALSPAAKTLCLLATCFAAWMSGAKQVGGRSGASDATTIRHEIEAPCTIPLATIGESNLVAITAFSACPANQTLAF